MVLPILQHFRSYIYFGTICLIWVIPEDPKTQITFLTTLVTTQVAANCQHASMQKILYSNIFETGLCALESPESNAETEFVWKLAITFSWLWVHDKLTCFFQTDPNP